MRGEREGQEGNRREIFIRGSVPITRGLPCVLDISSKPDGWGPQEPLVGNHVVFIHLEQGTEKGADTEKSM